MKTSEDNGVVVNLESLDTWDPAQVLAPDFTALWPLEANNTLAELTTKVLPRETVDGTLLRPGDVDKASGVLRMREVSKRGWSFLVDDVNLRPGDLLVTPDRPVVYVTSEFQGFQFSSSFLALRPALDVDSLWLWACLNSRIGESIRRSSSSGVFRTHLRPSQIPLPAPTAGWEAIRPLLLELANGISTSVEKVDQGHSWWRVTNLPSEGSWAPLLATEDPSIFDVGIRLGDLADDIQAGQVLKAPDEALSEPFVPVWGPAQLNGNPATDYASADSGVLANEGDVLVQRDGERGKAAEATSQCLVDRTLLKVSLHDRYQAGAVVAALNSAQGQRQRAFRATGTVVRRLSSAALAEIRLSFEMKYLEAPVQSQPLANLIDELIWP